MFIISITLYYFEILKYYEEKEIPVIDFLRDIIKKMEAETTEKKKSSFYS